ncbi:hypothetical protein A0J59_17480 [Cellulosimicrobium sp. I38E]|nr:hypothetical protein A0J59_17480 [Cellulosimicrobium sp. I38E]
MLDNGSAVGRVVRGGGSRAVVGDRRCTRERSVAGGPAGGWCVGGWGVVRRPDAGRRCRLHRHDPHVRPPASSVAHAFPQRVRVVTAAVVEDEDGTSAAERDGPRGAPGAEHRVPLRRRHTV